MLGLALEGGGAKGAFHMGAVKALLEAGYKFDGVAGTSIGALNGAAIVQGDFELAYEWWEKIDNTMLFDIDPIQIDKLMHKKIDKETLAYLSSKLKDIIDNRGLDTTKIREILDYILDEEKLRKSSMDFGMITVSVSDLKPLELYKEDIPEGKLTNYIMASANLPVFKSEPIEGKFYLDGGFYDNCPINLLARKGYEEIIAIRTFGIGIVRKVETQNIKITNIVPSEDLGMILNFDNKLIQRNLIRGYYDAKRVIQGLRGRKYYIQPMAKDDESFMQLTALPQKTILEIGELMGLPKMDGRRMLFEKIIPHIAKMLGLSSGVDYQDITIALLEYMAEERKVEKYKIRNFNDFLKDIKKADTLEKSLSPSLITSLAEKTKLTAVLSKEVILNRMGEEIVKNFK